MVYDLDCRYDGAKSFYGKAKVEVHDGEESLISYTTLVAKITMVHDDDPENGPSENDLVRKAIVYGTYSPTTLRHIKEFLRQAGFKAETKSQIIEDYME